MAQDTAKPAASEVGELVGLIVGDAERLLDQHARLLKSEIRQGLRTLPPALAAIGAGAGLAAVGGGLGVLMLVHGLRRSTRLPLWSCYGLVGGALAALGAGLAAGGARRAAGLSLVPRETARALREDAQWIKNQLTSPTR
jgi:hypothetical protein